MGTTTRGRFDWTVVAPALALLVLAGTWGRDLPTLVAVLVAVPLVGAVLAAVHHADWGRGEVMTVEDDRLTVLFEAAGYRTLSLELVTDGGLLRRLPAGT